MPRQAGSGDAANGYHSDGNGGCTTDVSVPNPCTSADRGCLANGTTPACVCRAGTHDEGGACVPDTALSPLP